VVSVRRSADGIPPIAPASRVPGKPAQFGLANEGRGCFGNVYRILPFWTRARLRIAPIRSSKLAPSKPNMRCQDARLPGPPGCGRGVRGARGVMLLVGVGVAVLVGVGVAVLVAVAVAVLVEVEVAVLVAVAVAVLVGVGEGVTLGVPVGAAGV
jgi:hypothetical protein